MKDAAMFRQNAISKFVFTFAFDISCLKLYRFFYVKNSKRILPFYPYARFNPQISQITRIILII
ncbi:MAG: hypothetical protein BA865_14430 [Desulfobacterales bacterium S5133MH4]|nr:MAG: hypothetical protein BA865_14430 [Desulfobacterales bacterium S5133MH4]